MDSEINNYINLLIILATTELEFEKKKNTFILNFYY